MKSFNKIAAFSALSAAMILAPLAATAQANIAPKSAQSQTGAKPNWTTEQLLTATVHDAWLLSGKDEATFFEMVEQLAALSAKNRGITLPDSEAAGRKMGNYIKTTAKADTDQLLYAVVDKAVLMTSKTPVHAAGAPRP
jgi:hypothetical protein